MIEWILWLDRVLVETHRLRIGVNIEGRFIDRLATRSETPTIYFYANRLSASQKEVLLDVEALCVPAILDK
jgi:hypothetical protein